MDENEMNEGLLEEPGESAELSGMGMLESGAEEPLTDEVLNAGMEAMDGEMAGGWARADVEQDSGAAGGEDSGAGTEAQESAEGESAGNVPEGRRVHYLYNGEEREVEVGSMSDEELGAALRKAKAYDDIRESENARTYRETYQKQLNAGMTEAVAHMIARDAAGGRSYALSDLPRSGQAGVPQGGGMRPYATNGGQTVPQARNLRGEVEQLRVLFPDLREIPDDVAKAVSQGVPVTTAYLAYRDRESASRAAQVEKENRVLKQNARSAERAPVSGSTGGGGSTRGKSLFERAFDSGFEW